MRKHQQSEDQRIPNPYQTTSHVNRTDAEATFSSLASFGRPENSWLRGVTYGIVFALLSTVGFTGLVVARDVILDLQRGYPPAPITFSMQRLFYLGLPGSLIVALAVFSASVATYSPRRKYPFLLTLGLVCLVSMPIAGLLYAPGMTPPPHYRSNLRPAMYWTEVLGLVLPFLCTMVALTLKRFQQSVSAGDEAT